MDFSKIDIFSSSFQFNFGRQTNRKGTLFGAVLSTILIITMAIFSAYLFFQFFSGQINPNYAQQNFISEEMIDVELSEDLVGFKYEYGVNLSLDDLQEQKNKTYLVFVPYLYYQNGDFFKMIQINVTKCLSPKLQGFNCFDFSTVKNYTLSLSTSDNISTNINMLIYKCQDVDEFKTFIPNNCADDSDFNSIINNPYADFRLKLKTSQYNTTSQKIQVNYRNSYSFIQDSHFKLYTYKTQKQITKLKHGAIIQSESIFSSPIQYNVENVNFDRQSFVQSVNQTAYMLITIEMDEIVQQIQIQYSTFTQILAQCNSTLAFLMCLGFLGRKFALKLMREEIFLLLLQNVFHGTYEKILKKNKLIDESNCKSFQNIIQQNQIKSEQKEEDLLKESNYSIFIPSFDTKSIKSVDNQYTTLQTQGLNIENNKWIQDEVIEKDSLMSQNEILNSNNFAKGLNSDEQNRFFGYKEQSYSPQNRDNFVESCSQNIQNSINQRSQIASQESLFQRRSGNTKLKKNHCIYPLSKLIKQPYRHKAEHLKYLQENYLKKTKTMKDHSILKNIQKNIFKTRIYRLAQYQQSQGLNKLDKSIIEEHINQSLDVLQLYKDLILLKKAIMILLTKEQLAALQLIGLSTYFLKQQVNNQKQNQYQDKKMSHFEEQFAILNQSNLQEKYLNSFLERILYNSEITEIDQRIIDSLL
ncbi:AMP-binding enzyme family protein (macronuclear) [Tetrahymena thermophila SB210]|uniref:AMP-binding enzyme family protein n=1 Tax=Tetrahymena thermophila (strain SB210) TaxID=312017 RepID=Q237M7_TETTS|nr:AMP-binding enzyme family protein [Tetrahymena thermophila SB210]EAR92714.1 AMP-binding enzyme family protein [Tetrahymena thermophila SB210]|eukprot:XP_001012959.1 AMP-binding enzyme family protein [Tetrahymena thermophila SB210]